MDVVYLSGGVGKRTKMNLPKQFAMVDYKPLMIYGLQILEEMPEIENIIMPSIDHKTTEAFLKQYNIKKVMLVDGGETRQQSTYNGLLYVKSKYVLIMEAVRPMVTKEYVQYIMNIEGEFVTPVEKAVSSVLTKRGGYIDRRTVGEVQMPQKYGTQTLLMAHLNTEITNASDDAVIMIDEGHRATWAAPLEGNIKVTSYLDLAIAEAILKEQKKGYLKWEED